ncbi:MAG: ATP-binding cassette domain-containing protein [Nitratireductor sp.]
MVFQQGALFEWMNVRKNISFGPDMAHKPAAETARKVDELLKIVGLKDFGDKMIYELSGGMQQRVALARCLANDPDVILMDEPRWAHLMRLPARRCRAWYSSSGKRPARQSF